MTGDLADPPIVIGEDYMNEENKEYEEKRRLEIASNFPLVLCPYEDAKYFEDLNEILRRDKEDFKRVVHAHLLSNGAKASGWDLQELKTCVKHTMGYSDNDEVDKFVAKHFHIKTFKEFLDKHNDIAIVGEDTLIMPFLDEINRDIFEDAVASSRNKNEKELRKNEQIAAKLELPENVEEFYRGINRVRQAVLNAYEKYESTTREGALAFISAMNGTTDRLIGVNFNFVCTEYKNLYGVDLTGPESKKICGRSTLMKGLAQGKPKCLVDTVAMEIKEKDLESLEKQAAQGAYIALKTASREYSEDEIKAAVEACRQLHSQTRQKLNRNRGDRGGGSRRTEPFEELQRACREQRERMAASSAPQPAPPLTHSTDSNGHVDAIGRQDSSTSNTNVGEEKAMRVSHDADEDELYEGESSDEKEEQIYSDEEDCVERHVAVDRKKRMRQMRREQSSNEEELPASTSHEVHSNHTLASTQPASLPTPQHTNHPEVPYDQLPPAPLVLSHDDKKETIDDLLETAATHTLVRHSVPSHSALSHGVNQRNAWEEEEGEPEAISQVVPELLQRHAATAKPTATIFTPTTIPLEAYQQNREQQSQPVLPPQKMQPQYDPVIQEQQQQQTASSAPPTPVTAEIMQGQQPQYRQSDYPQPHSQGQAYPQQGAPFVHPQSDFRDMSAQQQFHPQGGPPMHIPSAPRQYPSQEDPYYYPQQPQYPPGGQPPMHPGTHYGPQRATQTPDMNVVVNHSPNPDHPRQTRPNYPSQAPPPSARYVHPQGQPYQPSPPSQGPGFQPLARQEYGAFQQGRGPAAPPQGQDGYPGARHLSEHHGDPVYSSPHQQELPRAPAFGTRRIPPERRDDMPVRGGEPFYDERARAGRGGPSPPPQRQLRQPNLAPSPNEYRGFCKENVEREERRRRETRMGGVGQAGYEEMRHRGGFNQSHGGPNDDEWAFFKQLNDAKKRLRFQIILILQCMRDRNRENERRGDRNYEMMEVETTLHRLVSLGCGNEMEIYDALQPYIKVNSPSPFRDFLRQMQREGLVNLYSTSRRKGTTNALEEVVYVTDPFTEPPANYNMTKLH